MHKTRGLTVGEDEAGVLALLRPARLRVAASRPMALRAPSSAEEGASCDRESAAETLSVDSAAPIVQSGTIRKGTDGLGPPGGFVVLDRTDGPERTAHRGTAGSGEPKVFLRPKRNTRGGRVRPAETAVSDPKSVRTKNY